MAQAKRYQTKQGPRWTVRYEKPDGSQGRQSGFLTAEAAKDWARKTELAKTVGDYVDPQLGKIRVGDLAESWLAMKKAKLKPSSYAPLEAAWRNHVAPRWGGWPVAKVETTAVEDWITDMVTEQRDPDDPEKVTKPAYSATVVIRAHSVLAGILDRAVRDRRLTTNRSRGVENLPGKKKKPHVYLTHAQVDLMAGAAGDWATLVYLLAYTGLRWGEAVGLRVQDLQLLRRRVVVDRNVVEVGGRFHVGTPKSSEGRSVALPLFLVEELAKACEGKPRGAPVFEAPSGGFVRRPNSARGWFQSAAKKAGGEGLTPHDLRHTAASLAVQAGAHVKAVQRMLGHESAALTLDTYADLFDSDLDDVAAAMDRARERSRSAG